MSVVVWEWENKCLGQKIWIPYPPEVSNFIEKNYILKNISVDLKQFSNYFSLYQVDLNGKIQKTDYQERSIQRIECSADSSAGRRVCWQWLDEVTRWHCYSLQLSDTLEQACQDNIFTISFLNAYTLDLIKLIQINNNTTYERQIRRHTWKEAYTQTNHSHTMSSSHHNANSINTAIIPSRSASCLDKVMKVMKKKKLWKRQLKVKASNKIEQVDLDQLRVSSMEKSYGRFYKVLKNVQHPNEKCPICYEDFSTPSGYFSGTNILEECDDDEIDGGDRAYGSKVYDTSFTTNIPSTSNNNNSSIFKNSNDNNELNNNSNNSNNINNSNKINSSNNSNNINNTNKNNNNSLNVVMLKKCQHHMHFLCLKAMLQHSQTSTLLCPTCKHIYGIKYGNCPDGRMTYQICKQTTLPGFEDGSGLICVKYDIRDGFQKVSHPDPYHPFYATGFPRFGYLPNNEKGRKVLKLLIKAWERRLTFTIGTSITTGANARVVWNEIHHKTEKLDRFGHGYPDNNYLINVIAELSLQGVVDSDEEEDGDGGNDDGCDDDDGSNEESSDDEY